MLEHSNAGSQEAFTLSASLPPPYVGKLWRARVLNFVEQQFDLADGDKDGALAPEEVKKFLYLLEALALLDISATASPS